MEITQSDTQEKCGFYGVPNMESFGRTRSSIVALSAGTRLTKRKKMKSRVQPKHWYMALAFVLVFDILFWWWAIVALFPAIW